MSRMADHWAVAAADLGLEIITPFCLTLPDGRKLEFDLLLKNFGSAGGMLLTSDYGAVEYSDHIMGQGYGFSVMAQPRQDESYDRESFIEVLADWMWSGEAAQKPDWLPDPPADE